MELQVIILLFCIPLIALNWSLPEKWQQYPGMLITALFLGCYAPDSLAILLATTLCSYYILKYSKHIASATITVCLVVFSVFLFFKLGFGKNTWMERLLPLGISYYSFRQIHYAVEAYKRKLPPHELKDYLSYLFFLPTLLIGPIHRFPEFLKDSKRKRWNAVFFSEGLERILYGFAKVIIFGNYLLSDRAVMCLELLQKEEYIWLATYLDVFRFTANAYIQFAGFSDIAIGLSLLLGYRIIENFNYPFLAPNIADFWQRWHISLSTWCRDYVYFPFYSITRNPYIGVFFSMIILGLWHEISWQYFAWALCHVIAINTWHAYNHSAIQDAVHRFVKMPVVLGRIITCHFAVFSFVLIYHHKMADILRTYKILIGIHV